MLVKRSGDSPINAHVDWALVGATNIIALNMTRTNPPAGVLEYLLVVGE